MNGSSPDQTTISGVVTAVAPRTGNGIMTCELLDRRRGLIELYVPEDLFRNRRKLFQVGRLLTVSGAYVTDPSSLMAVETVRPQRPLRH